MHSTRLLANVALLALSALTLSAGLWTRYLGADALARQLWLIGIAPNWLALAVSIVRSLMRRQAGVDILAVTSISFALFSGEVLVAAVIALMLASGRALEDFAQARAQREMTALLNHVPKRANRFDGGQWHQVSLEKIQAGDRLPVDGTLSEPADLDESTLTGESLIRHRSAADAVCSGVLNVGAADDRHVVVAGSHGCRGARLSSTVGRCNAAGGRRCIGYRQRAASAAANRR